MPQADYQNETAILRGIMADPTCRVRYTGHALERMAQYGVLDADVREALTNGHVTLIETSKQDITWRVEGRDIDQAKLKVVAAVYEDILQIKIITVF